jgi:hypothetical protein
MVNDILATVPGGNNRDLDMPPSVITMRLTVLSPFGQLI